jgi:hypothetical protein
MWLGRVREENTENRLSVLKDLLRIGPPISAPANPFHGAVVTFSEPVIEAVNVFGESRRSQTDIDTA